MTQSSTVKPPQVTGKEAFQSHTERLRNATKSFHIGRLDKGASVSRKRAAQGQVHSHATRSASALHGPFWRDLERFLKEPDPEPNVPGQVRGSAEQKLLKCPCHSEVGRDRGDRTGCELTVGDIRQ